MAKDNFGQGKTASELTRAKHTGNPGGDVEDGRLVKHLDLSSGKSIVHIARFQQDGEHFLCSGCGKVLK